MVDGDGAALGKCDGVAYFDSVLHYLDYVSHIVAAVLSLNDGLNCFDVAVQLITQSLQLLNAGFVVTKLLEDSFIIKLLTACCQGDNEGEPDVYSFHNDGVILFFYAS